MGLFPGRVARVPSANSKHEKMSNRMIPGPRQLALFIDGICDVTRRRFVHPEGTLIDAARRVAVWVAVASAVQSFLKNTRVPPALQ